MSDKPTKKPEQTKDIDMTIYGQQGNEGQYGQGQYDSEGNPDPHGKQAQEIYPDEQKPVKPSMPKPATKPGQKNQYLTYERDVPLD